MTLKDDRRQGLYFGTGGKGREGGGPGQGGSSDGLWWSDMFALRGIGGEESDNRGKGMMLRACGRVVRIRGK
jgi:hypothetical protein